ncbi:hypothetical protein [Mucilaginibacter psychrotolerans]
MEVKKVIANPVLKEDKDKVALQRGPIMYAAEWKDNAGSVSNIIIPDNAVFSPLYQKDLLNGVTVLRGAILKKDSTDAAARPATLTAIPYYSWANRGTGEMTVWFPKAAAVK